MVALTFARFSLRFHFKYWLSSFKSPSVVSHRRSILALTFVCFPWKCCSDKSPSAVSHSLCMLALAFISCSLGFHRKFVLPMANHPLSPTTLAACWRGLLLSPLLAFSVFFPRKCCFANGKSPSPASHRRSMLALTSFTIF